MAIRNKNNPAKNPTYSSYLSGNISATNPVTSPPYSGTGAPTSDTSSISPVGNALRRTEVSYGANLSKIGEIPGSGAGGDATNEGIYTGGGAYSLPQINRNRSGSAGGNSSWLNRSDAGGQNLPATETPVQNSPSSAWSGTEPVDSYEQYLRNKENAYGTMRDEQTKYYDEQSRKTLAAIEEQRKATYEAAEKRREEAERRAETERERSVVDARSGYEQSKASYGANAEMIGSMGLSGSGYSDYLNSKAYAQQRAETQAANARADSSKSDARYTEDQTRMQADSDYYRDKLNAEQIADTGKFNAGMSYWENLIHNDDAIGKYRVEQEQKAENDKQYARAAYTELLSGANSGAYTAEQLEQLAADYNLSEAQKQSLIGAANEYNTKKQAAANAEIFAGTGDTAGSIQAAVDNGSITKEQGQTHLYNSYKSEIEMNIADTDSIYRAYQNGQITQTQYDDLKAEWNRKVDITADKFHDADSGAMMVKSAAKRELDAVIKNPLCSAQTKRALTAVYNAMYTPITGGTNHDGSAKELGDEGNNFKVAYGKTKYKVESAGKCNDINVKEVASNVENDGMFGYQGKIYIKKDGNIYEIRGRGGKITDDWSELYAKFFGDDDRTSASGATKAGASASWKSYEEAAADGYSNIMTRTEWARRKSSTGYSTYEDYLAGMYEKYMR